MSEKFIRLTQPIYDYLVEHRSDHDPVLAELARRPAPSAASA